MVCRVKVVVVNILHKNAREKEAFLIVTAGLPLNEAFRNMDRAGFLTVAWTKKVNK